jgi:Tfp pilus assembly PilM family ATPase
MGKEFIAGVSFSESTAQVAVLEIRNAEASIVYLEEFNRETINEFWYLDPLLTKSRKIFKKVDKVSVAFDHASLLMYAFPADGTLSHVDQQEHVRWELSNYIPDFHPQEYINDLHTLQTHGKEQVKDLLVVSAKRSLINRLQSALSDQWYELHVVDTNHFSSQYALLVNHPEVKTTSVALIALNNNRIDLGILHHGRLTEYYYTTFSSVDELCQFVQQCLEDYPKLELYVCGTAVTNELVSAAQKKMKLPLTKVNPFRKMPLRVSSDNAGAVTGQEHRFVASVGIALRRE